MAARRDRAGAGHRLAAAPARRQRARGAARAAARRGAPRARRPAAVRAGPARAGARHRTAEGRADGRFPRHLGAHRRAHRRHRLAAARLRGARRAPGEGSRSARRRARLPLAPGQRALERAFAAGGGAPHGLDRAAALAALASLLRAREPAPAPAQCARLAARARRGGLPRGPARLGGMDRALLRPALQAQRRRAGAAEAARRRVDQLRNADHLGEPRRGARLQVASRPHARLMRSLFWLLAVFAAAVALVIVGRLDAGYVLFVYPPWRVEVTMLFFALAASAGFVILYWAVRLLGQTVSLPSIVRAFRARRRRERAHAGLAAALQAYYEGRYARAE